MGRFVKINSKQNNSVQPDTATRTNSQKSSPKNSHKLVKVKDKVKHRDKPDSRQSKAKAKQNQVVTSYPDVAIARTEGTGYKAIKIVSITAIVGILVFLFAFFTTDIKDKILLAKSPPVQTVRAAVADEVAEKEVAEKEGDNNSTDSFSISTAPGVVVTIDKAEMMERLESMDDEAFRTFVMSLIEAGDFSYGNVAQGVGVAEEDVTGETEPVTEPRQTLEEAYAEAEALYPNAIDGSKRLKLIQDLNALDYMYYVAEDGDTLLELSKSFGVPLGQLVELNGIHDADKIPAGMIILFPNDTVQPELNSSQE